MKAYLVTSGSIFVVILFAHIARVVVEGVGVISEPIFALSSLIAVALSLWAFRLVRQLPK